MAKRSKHELGPVTRQELKKAGGSLREVYRRRAEAGDVGAKETVKRITKSDRAVQEKAQAAAAQSEEAKRRAAEKRLQERAEKDKTSIFHHRTKVIEEHSQ